jgi:hypothetical protein
VICATPAAAAYEESPGVHRIPAPIPGQSAKSFQLYADLALAKALFRDRGAVWVPRAVRHGSQLITRSPKPVIISTSPPIHTHFTALRLKQRSGAAWIADFRDPLTGNAGRRRVHTRRFDPFYERLFAAKADLIVVNTDNSAAYWRNLYPEYSAKFRVLWNGFDPDDFGAIPSPPCRPFTLISHVGDVYGDRDPRPLLRGLDRLIQRGCLDPKTVRLEFHGLLPNHTVQDEAFVRLRERGCVSHETGAPDKRRSEEVMRSSDMLVLIDFMEPARLQVPAKVFFYLRTGRPILAYTLPGSSAEQILNQSGIPSVCLHPSDSEEQIDAGVLRALAIPKGAYAANEWFFENFDAARQSKTLSRWISEVSGSRF